MTSRNYTYGLMPPVEGRELVMAQLAGAARYRNTLVEIELARREETDAALRELCPGLLECEADLAKVTAEIEDALAQQRGRNQKARGMTDDTDVRERLAELKPMRRELAARRKQLRAGSFADPATQARLAAINDKASAAVRAARASCGVFWGSYLLVEQAADAFRNGAPPVYRGFRGEGRIGVQIQGGISWSDASSGGDTRLRIVHAPQVNPRVAKNGRVLPLPGPRRRATQYELWLRIGSDGRDPIWARWPLILHRPIPDTARIMWAIVQRRVVAGKERWSLTLSLRDDNGVAFLRHDIAESGTVGIDIGYRLMPNGRQRVACWDGSDGQRGELAIPADVTQQWAKVEDIQSIRDQRHNEVREQLKSWLAGNDHPQWLADATETMHAWRRLARMDQLVVQWRGQRFDGDDAILETLEAWRTKERHLWQYQEQLRDQLIAWRKNYYREFAARMRRQYGAIAIEAMDLRDAIHDTLRPAEERETVTAQRRAARFAALSVLVGCLKDSGADVLAVEPAGTTTICCECRHDNDVGPELMYVCGGCGRTFDQDENAAVNIRARGEAAQKTRQSLASQSGTGVAEESEPGKRPTRRQRLAAARKSRRKGRADEAVQ